MLDCYIGQKGRFLQAFIASSPVVRSFVIAARGPANSGPRAETLYLCPMHWAKTVELVYACECMRDVYRVKEGKVGVNSLSVYL